MKVMPIPRFFTAVLRGFAFILAPGFATALTVDFDSGDTVEGVFTTNGAVKLSGGIQGGLSGSLGAALDNNFTNETLVTTAGFQASGANPVFGVSIYFRFATPTSNASAHMISIGLFTSPTMTPFGTTQLGSEFGINKNPFANTYTSYTTRFSSPGSEFTTNGAAVTLANGSWYKLTLDAIWNTTDSRYELQYKLSNSDANGVVGSALATSTFQDSIAPASYTSGVHPFFSFSGPSSEIGVGLVDNLSTPVPEPSALGLTAMTLLLFAHRYRRSPSDGLSRSPRRTRLNDPSASPSVRVLQRQSALEPPGSWYASF
jgi:hypothetical protein